jgi:hypothetical protein
MTGSGRNGSPNVQSLSVRGQRHSSLVDGSSKIPAGHHGTNLAGAHTRSCTASGQISSEESPTEPGLCRRRGISPLRSNRTLVVLAAEQDVLLSR